MLLSLTANFAGLDGELRRARSADLAVAPRQVQRPSHLRALFPHRTTARLDRLLARTAHGTLYVSQLTPLSLVLPLYLLLFTYLH